ncbi:MAG: ABC transporter permease [Chloroflexi bacterium]|nr:MAG: ABC transporter permease [Chloroflexota bacterium]
MTTVAPASDLHSPAAAAASRGAVALFWERLRKKKLAMMSLVVIVLIYGGGILAPVIAPYSYTQQNIDQALQGPSRAHPLGTDRLGRDMLSRSLYSARTTLVVSVAVLVSGSLLIGNGLGLIAGYRGGWVDNMIMRVGEIFSSLPGLPMLILVNAALSPRVDEFAKWAARLPGGGGVVHDFASYSSIFAALSLFFWVGTARYVRSLVLQLRERDFILAAQALGASTPRILVRHLLPNIAFIVVLQLSATLGSVAGTEVALTWFGVGVQPPTPSFGAMIYDGSGTRTFQAYPHLLLVPGLFVSSLLFAFALLGDAVNDVIRDR